MVSKEEFDRLCELAKLKISDDKYSEVCEKLEGIIEFASIVTSINANADTQEDTFVFSPDMMREDIVKESLSPDDFLENAPARRDDFFLIRRGK